MRLMKKISFWALFLVLMAPWPVSAQMIPHTIPPSSPPVASPPAPSPIVVPILPVPTAPTLIPQLPTEEANKPVQPPIVDKAAKEEEKKKEPTITELKTDREKAFDAYYEQAKKLDKLMANLFNGGVAKNNYFLKGPGSFYEAENQVGIYNNKISSAQRQADRLIAELEAMDISDSRRTRIEAQIANCYTIIAECEVQVAYWTAERDRRAPLQAELEALKSVVDGLAAVYQSYDTQINTRVIADKTARAAAEAKAAAAAIEPKADAKTADKKADTKTSAEPDTVKAVSSEDAPLEVEWPSMEGAMQTSLGDIDADKTQFADQTGLSAETMGFKQPETLQELREFEQGEAFKELSSANIKYSVFNTLDVSGQVAQAGISLVPSLSVFDTTLAASRGFAEALGSEWAKGSSLLDAAKAAAINAGYTGAISLIGNKLTSGADKWADRVVVLTDVGFSKLKTKQIAELGANGISFLVVKTGQMIGSAWTDVNGRKLAKNLSSSERASGTSLAAPSFGGYGTSTATQPLVHY